MTDLSSLQIGILFLGTFAAAFVTGVAGFAFGLVAVAVWLYALAPPQVTALIVSYGLLVQGYAVWKLRHKLNIARLAPLIVGSAIGVPFGVLLLARPPASQLRVGIGAVLILFSLYNLLRPSLPVVQHGGALAEGAAGFVNGLGELLFSQQALPRFGP